MPSKSGSFRAARRAVNVTVAIVATLVLASSTLATDDLEVFALSLESPVSDGVPGAGAGNIERTGSVDQYDITLVAGTVVYFDELGGGCGIRWSCQAPGGSMVFDSNIICSTDPGTVVLDESGTYTITVFGNGSTTGTYSFTIWEVNPSDEFVITTKQVVSDGSPGPGAGNIEEPGTSDLYTFTGSIGDELYFDELSGGCAIRWTCESPSAATVFADNAICSIDPGVITLAEDGTYTIEVYGNGSATGAYSFTIWEVNRPDLFVIGLEEVVSDGVPGPGAGNIEEAGTFDEYTFSGTAGTEVYFDELSGSCAIVWTCESPSAATVFAGNAICSIDPGVITLAETGTYTIRVSGNASSTGTYSFILWELNPPDLFAIGLEQTVADGAPGPGAGNIEEPGTTDVYTFTGSIGDELYFDELGGGCSIRWECRTPGDASLFAANAFCSLNPGAFMLAETGTYTITVSGNGSATGTYSFIIWEVNAPDVFPISLDEVVAEDVPGPGAGNIEEPGANDVYTFTVAPGDLVCFEELGGPCALDWECRDEDDTLIFADGAICANRPGRFELALGGTYTITVGDPGGVTGTYSFIVNTGRIADLTEDCVVAVDDLLLLLASWGGPDGDLDGSGTTDTVDLLLLLADWG